MAEVEGLALAVRESFFMSLRNPVALGSRVQCELLLSEYTKVVEKKMTLSRVVLSTRGEIYGKFQPV